jgi:hypothetical protein
VNHLKYYLAKIIGCDVTYCQKAHVDKTHQCRVNLDAITENGAKRKKVNAYTMLLTLSSAVESTIIPLATDNATPLPPHSHALPMPSSPASVSTIFAPHTQSNFQPTLENMKWGKRLHD